MLRRKMSLSVLVSVWVLLLIISLPMVSEGAPKRGGSLKIVCLAGDVRSLGYGPETRLNFQILYSNPVTETLLRWDEKGLPAPHLATTWKIANDLKSITFSLRKEVKFHDGTDFDAEAVKFNLEQYQKSGRDDLNMVSSIEVIDPYTVRLNFKYYSNMLLTWLTQAPGYMTSPTAIKKMTVAEIGKNPVGTGPFKFKSWKRDLSIKFERFDSYWQKGKPYLDEFEWILIKEPMTAVASLKSGEVDGIIGLPVPQAVAVRQTGQYIMKHTRHGQLSMAGDSVNPNSPFAKLKVRQAVSHAIDSKTVVESVMQGFGEVTNQFSSPTGWGYNRGVTGYPYDPQKAKKLLAEAGYPTGFKTTLWWANHGINPTIASTYQASLKEVGIDAEVKLLENAGWMDKIRSGWDGLMRVSTNNAVPDDCRGATYLSLCKSSLWKSIECNKEIDDILTKAHGAPDFETKKAMVQTYNKTLVDKYCLVNFVFIEPLIGAFKKEVQDGGFLEISSLQFNPADIYLNK